jgi:hypothetical protein
MHPFAGDCFGHVQYVFVSPYTSIAVCSINVTIEVKQVPLSQAFKDEVQLPPYINV